MKWIKPNSVNSKWHIKDDNWPCKQTYSVRCGNWFLKYRCKTVNFVEGSHVICKKCLAWFNKE